MKKLTPINKKMFLVKMPRYLGDQIKSYKNNSVIGFIKSTDDKYEITFEKQIKPRNYVVSYKNEQNKVVANLENDENCLVNQLDHFLNISPVMDSHYFAFKKELKNNREIVHKTQTLNHFEELRRGEKYANLKEMEAFAKKKKEQLIGKKRERLDKGDVIDILFKAFEKYSNWTVKDLSDFSGQPVAYIQEIINDIAVLDKKDHRNTYILKEEFKDK